MKKNGFVFIETVIVLVMVALSLSLMLASYALVVRRNEINKYYNRPIEMYAVYYLFKMGSTSTLNYQDVGVSTIMDPDGSIERVVDVSQSFWVNRDNCNTNAAFGKTLESNCREVMKSMDIINAGIIVNVEEAIKNHYSTYDNATISFLSTLQVYKNEKNSATGKFDLPIRYAVAEFFFDNTNYFASVPLYDEVEE